MVGGGGGHLGSPLVGEGGGGHLGSPLEGGGGEHADLLLGEGGGLDSLLMFPRLPLAGTA